MSTEITTSSTFAQRMYERIRDSMGDLMSDKELKPIVERCIEEAFFKPKPVIDHYGKPRSGTGPSEFVLMVKPVLEEAVKAQVNAYFAENSSEIKESIAEVLSDGIGALVIRHIQGKLQEPLYALQASLSNKGLF